MIINTYRPACIYELLKANPDKMWLSAPKTVTLQLRTLNGFTVEDTPLVGNFTVNFRDWNEELRSYALVPDAEQQVQGGEAATPPTPAGKSGEVFK